ncbi:MAG TPA: arsenosugar biosynthesis radical SAM (seleno)protein ArsS [Candidatus Polarisedimenticolaceae bacterium]|nr:arsenosugar biosynthesis radical SAM (seleno)protein ArsS [Candidatus Polarisedimenticolaceae bacterium]
MPSLLSVRHPLASPTEQLRTLARTGAPAFDAVLESRGVAPLETRAIEVLQVNVGKLCNQTCGHCHVDAGPDRRESMTHETAEQVVELLTRHPIPTLDITGGAPELSPEFRFLVEAGRRLGRRVIDRCNLTVLLLPSQDGLVPFLAEHRVDIVASLPSFRASGTDTQRGEGVFAKSVAALRRLNDAGYGTGRGLVVDLVHNPVGAFLPGTQASLERDYRRELRDRHGVVFDRLLTIANMPISRFLEFLERTANTGRYMDLLLRTFNPAAAAGVMCRTHLSVGWDGALYDCDFNQMLELPVDPGGPATLRALLERGGLSRRVRTDRHCLGCTAGAGSSCGGALE